MSKNKKPHTRRTFILGIVICTLCLAMTFATLAVLYIHKFDHTLMEENRAHLSETAEQIAAHTSSIIEDTRTSLTVTAEAVSAIGERDNIVAFLIHIQEHLGFSYIGYAGTDGLLKTTYTDETEDISQEKYFVGALNGETQVTGLTRKIMYDKAVSGILLAAPVYDTSKEVTGVLIAMLDIKNLQSVMNVSSFDDNGYVYMIDQKGELVLHTKSMDYNNFFMLLKNVTFENGYSLSKVTEDIASGKPGLALYNNLGIDQYAYYLPMGLNDWTIVNIVAKEAVTANTAILTRDLAFLCIISVAIFVILLAVAAVTYVNSENQRHTADMKSIFLANMSHELRTPMNAVVGASELLLREELTDRQKNYVNMIANSGKSLLSIINDILDFSKIESGKFTLMEEPYSLNTLIQDITPLTVIRIGHKRLIFYVDLDNNLPARLNGDMSRLRQIMINLLSNAVKFTEQGYIYLRLSCHEEEKGLRLTIQVTDTGIGIRKQDMERLFTSFNQVDTHKSHNLEGTGLGLAISRQLARLMTGDVTAESTYGSGSTFTASVLQGCAGTDMLYDTAALDSMNILIYEPAEELRRFYRDTLSRLKTHCTLVSDTEELRSEIKNENYHYIIADQNILESLSIEGLLKDITPVLLLHQEEYASYSQAPGRLSVYAPLFVLGISGLIHPGLKSSSAQTSSFNISDACTYPDARVLLVDDNELNLDIAEALLSIYKMKIDRVVSGRQAVKAVTDTDYDLIFMDHMMPDMDGIEALFQIRSLPGGKYQDLPVIALTANATREAQAMFKEAGFDGFISKPIDVKLLDSLLDKYLGSQK